MILRLNKIDRLSRHRVEALGACSIHNGWRAFWIFTLVFMPILLFADYQYHTVKKGDTLSAISRKYGVSVNDIKKLNNMSSDQLSIGRKLKIKELPKPKPAAKAQPSVTITPEPPPAPQTPAAKTEAPDQSASTSAKDVEIDSWPLDFYHIVKPREGAYRISQNYGIKSSDFLAWNGKQSWGEFDIHPGDKLFVKDPASYISTEKTNEVRIEEPAPPELKSSTSSKQDTVIVSKTYTVKKGDTLYSISKAHNMTVDELQRLNNLSSTNITAGQTIYIVGGPVSGSSPSVKLSDLEGTQMIRNDLFTPVQGRVSSEFGLRNGRPHKGIDIAAKAGTPIYAVLDGTVVFSGVQGGYGNVVVIEHPDFVMTVYAHNEVNLVALNDVVKKGQQIAMVGNTGNSTGPHLHFEYRIKGQAINPRKVLAF